MLYHCTYRKRDGSIEIMRTSASTRAQAIRNVIARTGCRREGISAVAVGSGAKHYGGMYG